MRPAITPSGFCRAMTKLDGPTSDRRSWPALWPKLLLLIVALLIPLCILEWGARLLGFGQIVEFVPDDACGFLARPSQTAYVYGQRVRINSLGLRGPELVTPKPSGTSRVVFVGDSITYGGGKIPEERLFCRAVATSAQQQGLQIEAVNLAIPAWSPQNWWRYIEKYGLHQADAVVLVLPECDLARQFNNLRNSGLREHSPPLRLQMLFEKVCEQFAYDSPMGKPPRDEVADANVESVAALKQRCGDTPFLTVFVPSQVPSPNAESLWPMFESQLVDVLDLRHDFPEEGFMPDGVHLSVAGHTYVAERILPRLRDLLRTRAIARQVE